MRIRLDWIEVGFRLLALVILIALFFSGAEIVANFIWGMAPA